jgi:hypothetical protein
MIAGDVMILIVKETASAAAVRTLSQWRMLWCLPLSLLLLLLLLLAVVSGRNDGPQP